MPEDLGNGYGIALTPLPLAEPACEFCGKRSITNLTVLYDDTGIYAVVAFCSDQCERAWDELIEKGHPHA